MMPDSTWNSRSPVTGRLDGCWTPDSSPTSRAMSKNRSVLIPMSMPYMVSSASTVSSMGALPARSPMPFTVVWITLAPSATASAVLATPIPKSMWKWVSRGTPSRRFTCRAKKEMACGDVTPKVSTRPTVSTCPALATASRSSSSSTIPARVASMGKKETLSPFSWA